MDWLGINPLDLGLESFHHLISTFSIILEASSNNELNDWHGAPAGANPLGSGLSWYKAGNRCLRDKSLCSLDATP